MSRTIRCKNPSCQKPRHWMKAFGYDWVWTKRHEETEHTRDGLGVRADDKHERYLEQRYAHGESRGSCSRSPNHGHRNRRERQMRMHNKQELHKEVVLAEYEGLYWREPLSCVYDWR